MVFAEDLARRRKGERQKATTAMRWRQETTVTWHWIAEKPAQPVISNRGSVICKQEPVVSPRPEAGSLGGHCVWVVGEGRG